MTEYRVDIRTDAVEHDEVQSLIRMLETIKPLECVDAVRHWDADRVAVCLPELIEIIMRDRFASKQALMEHPDIFLPYARRIAEALSEHTFESFMAGQDWSDEVFEKTGDILVEGVLKDPSRIYSAMCSWPMPRYELFADILADEMKTRPDLCYDLGCKLAWDRLKPVADTIITGILESPRWTAEALIGVPYWDFMAYNNLQFALIEKFQYNQIPSYWHRDINVRQWWAHSVYVTPQRLAKVTAEEYDLINQTHEIARNGGQTSAFYEGLGKAIDWNVVKPWANSIKSTILQSGLPAQNR